MSQVSILPVQTAVSYVGSNIAIRTFYSAGSYSYVFIANAPGSLFGTPYVEGELVAVVPTGTAMYLNVAGELIINAPDAANYSIDSPSGELIYTE